MTHFELVKKKKIRKENAKVLKFSIPKMNFSLTSMSGKSSSPDFELHLCLTQEQQSSGQANEIHNGEQNRELTRHLHSQKKERNHSDINIKNQMSILFLTGIKERWCIIQSAP